MKKLLSIVVIALLSLGTIQAQTVLFYENFATGIPASWYNGGTSNGTPNPYVKFVRRTNQTLGSPYNYTDPQGVITSPTRSNGYISFNSDSLDGGGTGAQGSGPAPTIQSVTLAPPGINVAGYNALKLEFYQYLSSYQSATYLDLSTDSVTWVTDTLNADLGVNEQTALADERVSLDISSITAGHNTLYIRFRMDADYYFWNIDDIKVYEVPNSDLTSQSFQGRELNSGLDLFYSKFPLSQADSVTAVSFFGNVGKTAQPNTTAVFTIAKGASVVDTYTSTPYTLPAGTDTFEIATLANNGVGNYTAKVRLTSDSTDYNPADNVDSFTYAVTDSVYSINTSTAIGNGYFLLRNLYNYNFRLGTVFQVTNKDTVTSVTTAMLGGARYTKAGAVIKATIYLLDVSPTAITYTGPTISSFNKTLAATDLSTTTLKPITLQLDPSTGSAVLDPGIYWVALEGVSTPDSNILVAATKIQRNGLSLLEESGTPGQFSLVSTTDGPYLNLNFGHNFNTLYCNFNRTPPTSPLRVGQIVTYTGSTNGGVATSTYAWEVTGLLSGYSKSGTGKVWKDTLTVEDDSMQVCLTVTDGLNTATNCKIIRVREPLAIAEVGFTETALTPNPTSGSVTISTNDVTGALAISVTNLLGAEVKRYNETANGSFTKTYNLSDLSAGVYIVKLQNGSNSVTKRLSISK